MDQLQLARGAIRSVIERTLSTRHLARRMVSRSWVSVHHRGTVADLNVIRQCLEERQYEIPAWRPHYRTHADNFYQVAIARGQVPLILDCGANIGAAVLWFRFRYPRAHIIAVEPAPDNFALLARNCDDPHVSLRAAAVGEVDGFAVLSDPGEGSLAYRLVKDGPGSKVSCVSIATLLHDACPARCQPFILKIDIEGAEKELFSGGWEDLDRFPVIAIEPHDWIAPGRRVASPLFRFHAEKGRDFAHRGETVFSIAYDRLQEAANAT